MGPIKVVASHLLEEKEQTELLAFASSSFRKDGNCIGWLTTAAIVGAHEQHRIVACYNNADLVGYIIWGESRGIIRCFVVWVRNDARLIIHGRSLVDWITKEGARRGSVRVELWCAVDLAANMFWAALGFERVCWRWGRGKRSRRHWLWRLPISPAERAHHTVESQLSV